MNRMNREVKDKLKYFLSPIISQYKLRGKSEILSNAKETINSGYKKDILMYYYFFSHYLEKDESSDLALNELDNHFADTFLKKLDNSIKSDNPNICLRNLNPQRYEFLSQYGSMRPQILSRLWEVYNNNDQLKNKDFSHFTLLFLNNKADFRWEKKCAEKFEDKIYGTLDNYFSYLIAKSINGKLHYNAVSDQFVEEKILKYFDYRTDDHIKKSKSDLKIILEQLNQTFEIDKFLGVFKANFYIPNINTIVEFDGAEYLFPLQTQLIDPIKFRYWFMSEILQKRVVSIPYYEWGRYSNYSDWKNLVYKLLYSSYNLQSSTLFKTNFDTTIDTWTFTEVKQKPFDL